MFVCTEIAEFYFRVVLFILFTMKYGQFMVFSINVLLYQQIMFTKQAFYCNVQRSWSLHRHVIGDLPVDENEELSVVNL